MNSLLRQPGQRIKLAAISAVVGCCAWLLSQPPPHSQAGPPPLDDEDTQSHLMRGTVQAVQVAPDQPNTFSFTADGPGILTIFHSQPGVQVDIDLFDPLGKPYRLRKERKRLEKDQPQHHLGIAVIEAPGDYRLRVLPKAKTTLVAGSSWLPFPEIEQDKQKQANNEQWVVHELPHHLDDDTWLSGLPALPMGSIASGRATARPRSYHFKADGPGLLTVSARTRLGRDIAIQLRDDNGNKMPKGFSDRDFNGNQGAEDGGFMIPKAGHYEVAIIPMEGGADYWFGASWIRLAQFKPDEPEASKHPEQPPAPQDQP